MEHRAQTSYADFSWKDFVAAIYKREPEPAHTFTLEFLTEIPKDSLQKYLAHFVMYGAKTLYKKELAALTPEEIAKLQQYMNSIGWQADYKVETRDKKLDERSDTLTKVNIFLIDFSPCKRDELNDNNKPDRFA
jgi:hypothetical protein